MVLLPIAAAALAINAMLVVSVADYVTERDQAKADQGMSSAPEAVEAASGM